MNWFEDLFTSMEDFTERVTYDNGGMLALATAARIDLYQSPRDRFLLNQIIDEANGRDGEELLDLIHYALQPTNPGPFPVNTLNQLLIDGGSVWNATPTGLQRRVDPPVQAAFEAASSPHDVASTELEEAWRNTYGRHPDASDAWDHAIKAVEAILIPIILPNQDKPTLGQIVGHLKAQGRQWRLPLPGPNDDHDVHPLVAMLQLLWPNPDRHGSPQHRRPPTLAEAQAVVHLAVTIVQWGRDGQIVRRH